MFGECVNEYIIHTLVCTACTNIYENICQSVIHLGSRVFLCACAKAWGLIDRRREKSLNFQ